MHYSTRWAAAHYKSVPESALPSTPRRKKEPIVHFLQKLRESYKADRKFNTRVAESRKTQIWCRRAFQMATIEPVIMFLARENTTMQKRNSYIITLASMLHCYAGVFHCGTFNFFLKSSVCKSLCAFPIIFSVNVQCFAQNIFIYRGVGFLNSTWRPSSWRYWRKQTWIELRDLEDGNISDFLLLQQHRNI